MEPDAEPSRVRPLAQIDLAGVAEGLANHGDEWRYWYDPSTGRTEIGPGYGNMGDEDEEWDPVERGLVEIRGESSRPAYEDMETFAEAVGDRRASDLLLRALEGRGAFRRFRGTMDEFDELEPQWRSFARAGEEIRAIEWLAEEGFVSDADAAEQLAVRRATRTAVLAAIGMRGSLDVEVAAFTDRLDEIERELDHGHEVRLLRDGCAWAFISPA